MKTFRFESISLLSHIEGRARKISFSPRRNLLVGQNHTGKSSVIKALFAALGAYPEGALARWDTKSVTLLEFSINGNRYSVLYQHPFRALFDSQGSLLFSSSKDNMWGAKLAEILGFNLVLTNQDNISVKADARAFFLPFYINQDGSWFAQWGTFKWMSQFKAPIPSILQYFTGVKPPRFYEVNSLRRVAVSARSNLQSELQLVEQVRKRLEENVPANGPKTIPAVFEQDVAALTREVTALNEKQEVERSALVDHQEALASLQLQIRMAEEALHHYDGDAQFLRIETHSALVCPTCGAEHTKTFLDLLTYADDARVLRDLVLRLKEDAIEVARDLATRKAALSSIEADYRRVQAVLETRRGDLRFDDVVRGLGAEVAFSAFEEEMARLTSEINPKQVEIDKLDAELATLVSNKRSAAILKGFRAEYTKAAALLNVSGESRKMLLASRPNLSGSGGPRSILAYYAAIWETSLGEYGSFSVPLVIDSLQQQGQDEDNLPRMMAFVSSNLPPQAQVILGAEAITDATFDRIVHLNEPYKLLQQEEFETVSAVIDPLILEMYQALQSDVRNPS